MNIIYSSPNFNKIVKYLFTNKYYFAIPAGESNPDALGADGYYCQITAQTIGLDGYSYCYIYINTAQQTMGYNINLTDSKTSLDYNTYAPMIFNYLLPQFQQICQMLAMQQVYDTYITNVLT